MNSNRSAAQLCTVINNIIRNRTNTERFCFHLVYIIKIRRCKRMVHSHYPVKFFAVFKHREVNNPQKCVFIFIYQTQFFTKEQSESAHYIVSCLFIISDKENNIARFCISFNLKCFYLFFC